MTLSREAKANLVTAAIAEDRTEIRLNRDRFYSVTMFTTVGSFGITSFLLGKEGAYAAITLQTKLLMTYIDGALLLMLWALCFRLMINLKLGQLWLEARQRLLDALVSNAHVDSGARIYDIAPGGQPGIRHHDLYWTISAATAAVAIKLAALWLMNL